MGRGADRDERVDRLLSGAFADRSPAGRWLVAGSLPQTEAALADAGAEVGRWRRFAVDGQPGTAEPPGEGYAGAVVRWPRGAVAAELTLHLVGARLAAAGELWVGGANDEGIRGAERRLSEVMVEVGEGTPGGHGRRFGARGPRPGLRGSLDDWAEPVTIEIAGEARTLTSWPGLFAHGHLDPGTELLLAHLPDLRGASVLDFGCGAGVVARVAVDRGAGPVTASDHDGLAVHATRRNVPEAAAVCADGVPPGSWDLILSNPPIHRGNNPDWTALEGLAAALGRQLRPGGSALIVTQVTVPVRTLFAGAKVERVGGDPRYAVWRITPSAV